MRRANEAVTRQRHPIPNVDDVLHEMKCSEVFSKIDLKYGYHQLDLDEESRSVTTFVVHCGLYGYKRLFFGINAASEVYDYETQKTRQWIEGVANISDGIIIHAATQEEDDKRL